MGHALSLALLIAITLFIACAAPAPAPVTSPAPVAPSPSPQPALSPPVPPTPRDTSPPPAVTGLVAAEAYNGGTRLNWQQSTAADFDYYNLYVSKTIISNVTGRSPAYQIKDINSSTYQITGLENGTTYYFAVTAVDKGGNEDKSVAAIAVTPLVIPRGTADPALVVEINQLEKTWAGTTILADNHDLTKPRIIEVNMLGEVVWQYPVPAELREYTNPGFDVEPLPNGNVLFVLPRNGVYEIDRKGNTVWSYRDSKVSHDADRLPSGNTLVVFGAADQMNDAQVKEVDPQGKVVWAWYARDYFNRAPYKNIFEEGWTHTNAASRLPNGNTLISPRNFHFVVEVDAKGAVVRTIGEGMLKYQHDPEMLANGNILLADHNNPQSAMEIDPRTSLVVWQFVVPRQLVRDANRLPNGNTLITGATTILEVTADSKVVWQLSLKGLILDRTEAPGRGFYKAERIGTQKLAAAKAGG